jgi:hypothetical protein
LCLVAAGCADREVAPVGPHIQSTAETSIQQLATTKVDMLFVIDDSYSMHDEQEKLGSQIESLARELIHPSSPTTPPVADLHIGIVSTDMGTGGYPIKTCENSLAGESGVLHNTGLLEGCQASYGAPGCEYAGGCPWLEHSTDAPDDGSDGTPPIWQDFACIATLGTDGCGFEQQLEASLQALTVQTDPGMPNEGFLRDDSLVAVVYVTDEDDCSSPDAQMFDPSRAAEDRLGPINTRCAYHRDMLYPIQRYVDAFRALRPGREQLVVVAAITGIPTDGTWDYGDALSDLEGRVVDDPANPETILPVCRSSMGEAVPATRFVELAYAFRDNGIIESICEDDWRPALQAITKKIQEKLTGTCMPTELASTSADTCRVVETLQGDGPCPDAAVGDGERRSAGWRVDAGLDAEGNRRCEILPADYDGDGCPDGASDCEGDDFTGALQGWFYDSDSPDCAHGQVRFTSRDVSSNASTVSFQCLTARCPVHRTCVLPAQEAAECDPNVEGSCGAGSACVRQTSGEVCGWRTVVTSDGEEVQRPLTCARCSQTLGARCETWAVLPEQVSALPLVGAGGCCAEGFHCEDTDGDATGDACLPDRTTACE